MLPVIVSTVGAVGAATFAGFHTRLPKSQLYGRTFIGIQPNSRLLALTYDDGPNDPYTGRLLDVLARHSVKATFFMIGNFVRQKPEMARMVVAAGHAIGNHTWNHPNLVYVGQEGLRQQITQTQREIGDVTGVRPILFRPPFGGRRPVTLRTVRDLGLEPIMWSVTCSDWRDISTDDIVRKAENQIRGGDVILLHDGRHREMGADRSKSIEATDRLLSRYKAEGYHFVTIPEIMANQPTQTSSN